LLEETGLDLRLDKIGSFRPIPGLTPQTVTVCRGTVNADLASAVGGAVTEAEDEIVARRFVPRHEIPGMIHNGDITDGLTLCSLSLAYLR
jgi:8-oxo-dGTP pyrophosphatase MutT (NUDIX family)